MKTKLIISAIFLLVAFFSLAQTQYLPLGSPGGNNISGVNAYNALQLPSGVDTPSIAGTKGLLKDSVGMLFYKTTDASLWIRIAASSTSNRWSLIGFTGGANRFAFPLEDVVGLTNRAIDFQSFNMEMNHLNNLNLITSALDTFRLESATNKMIWNRRFVRIDTLNYRFPTAHINIFPTHGNSDGSIGDVRMLADTSGDGTLVWKEIPYFVNRAFARTYFGYDAGGDRETFSGSSISAFGYRAGWNLSNGSNNVSLFGTNNARGATTARDLDGFGVNALFNITTGSMNTAYGTYTLNGITTQGHNVAVGAGAFGTDMDNSSRVLEGAVVSGSIALGLNAGNSGIGNYTTPPTYNNSIFIGRNTGSINQGVTLDSTTIFGNYVKTDLSNVMLLGNATQSVILSNTNTPSVNFGAKLQTTSFGTGRRAIATNYTATPLGDNIIDLTVSGLTVTLPTATGHSGLWYNIKLLAAGTGTVAAASGEFIDGSPTFLFANQFESVIIVSNGTGWDIFGTVNSSSFIINEGNVTWSVDTIACSPTGIVTDGTKVLVCHTGATGAFATWEDSIATLIGGVWNFEAAALGDFLNVQQEDSTGGTYKLFPTGWVRILQPHLQGGNAFGVPDRIGSRDSRVVVFTQRNLTRGRIDNQGHWYINDLANAGHTHVAANAQGMLFNVPDTALEVVAPLRYNTTRDTLFCDDCGGGTGTIPNLQQVTDVGNVTTNSIYADSLVGTSDARIHTVTFGRGTTSRLGDSLNILIGNLALSANTTGYRNVAIGDSALMNITTSINNVAIGFRALRTSTASSNVAVGQSALSSNTSGTQNVAMGTNSLTANTTGSSNVAVGQSALLVNTTGNNNIAMGQGAAAQQSTSSDNVAIGSNAFNAAISSSQNVAIGASSLNQATEGNNIAIGYRALQVVSGGRNTAVGSNAMASSSSGNTAMGNTAVGDSSFKGIRTGNFNVGLGLYSGLAVSSGNYNIAIGDSSLRTITTGSHNIGIGYNALTSAATNSNSIAIGANSSAASYQLAISDSITKMYFKNIETSTNPTSFVGIDGSGNWKAYSPIWQRGVLSGASATTNIISPITNTDTVFLGNPSGMTSGNKPMAAFNNAGNTFLQGVVSLGNGGSAMPTTHRLVVSSPSNTQGAISASADMNQNGSSNVSGISVSATYSTTVSTAGTENIGIRTTVINLVDGSSTQTTNNQIAFKALNNIKATTSTDVPFVTGFQSDGGLTALGTQKATSVRDFWAKPMKFNLTASTGTSYNFYSDSLQGAVGTYLGASTGTWYGFYQQTNANYDSMYNVFKSRTSIGTGTTPTAKLFLGAGSTSANTASAKIATGGALMTTPEANAIETDDADLYFTATSTRYKLDKSLSGSATLDFASTAAGAVADLTITVTGAADGDAVVLGVPNGSVTATATFTAWVSAANTVKVRFSPKATEDPASGTFKVRVIK